MTLQQHSMNTSDSWREVTVDDIRAPFDNALATGPFGSSISSQYFKTDGIPVIRGSNLSADSSVRLIDEGLVYLSKEKAAEFKRSTVRQGDLVFTCWGTINQVGLIDERARYSEYVISNKQMKLSPDPSKADSLFLYYLFSNSELQQLITNSSIGSSVPGFNLGLLRSLHFRIPPLLDQRAIAAVLNDTDDLLAGLERLIAKKRAVKQAAMQQLLTGKTRLPGFDGQWQVEKIGAFAQSTAGGTPSTTVESFWGGHIRWMNSGELNLKFVKEVEGRITHEGLKNSSTKLVPPQSVLIGLAGQGRTRGTVAMNLVELCTNQSIAAVLPSPRYVPEYLYYNLDARYEELRIISSGDGGRGGLNLHLIKGLDVPLPSLAEQRAIAGVLSDMDAEIAALEQKRDKTRALKQGMMQELLTGRIRLV